jgi:hypothetical protein
MLHAHGAAPCAVKQRKQCVAVVRHNVMAERRRNNALHSVSGPNDRAPPWHLQSEAVWRQGAAKSEFVRDAFLVRTTDPAHRYRR